MNAVILAGGKGTRLRPLTLNTPKPIVPILNRPFLALQIELLKKTGIEEIVLSLSYQPRRIEEIFGDGSELGARIHYTMEPEPLGTAGAVKNAEPLLSSRIVVFNGDVLSDLDLGAVLRFHEEVGAKATIVLTPVANPSAYGLVETGSDGRVARFLEKPSYDEITCDTINAGVYVLEPELLDYIPAGKNYSFERGFFPHLLRDRVPFFAYVHRGYWIDIGTPEKYLKVHRDILSGVLAFQGFHPNAGGTYVDPEATVESGSRLIGPAYVGAGTVVKSRAVIEPYAVIGPNCRIEEGATVRGSVLWSSVRIGEEAQVEGALIGRSAHIGHHAVVDRGVVLGDKSVITDYSRIAPSPQQD
ncbi:MAG: sugar phosphate nucleotidyltransferase [Vicinamibacteria bacterium]